MKEKLIQLATEKGFKSELHDAEIKRINYGGSRIELSKLLYYLWMCELQMWQRDVNNIYVFIMPHSPERLGWAIFNGEWSQTKASPKYGIKDPNECLETGLYESLKLLP